MITRAKVPAAGMLKRELVWLHENKCKAHGVSYAAHYNCFLREKPHDSPFHEKIGSLDIETSNLHANFGIMFCYAIKDLETGKVLGRSVTREDMLSYRFDKSVVRQFTKDVQGFDRLLVYWGKDRRHDIPFLRSRALKYSLDDRFPRYREILVQDVYDIARNKLSLHRYRLVNVAQFLKVPAKKHFLDPERWQKAQAGHQKSLDWIWKHVVEDVETLAGVWDRLEKFIRRNKQSV